MTWLFLAALTCAVATSVVLAAIFWLWIRPRLIRELDRELAERVDHAAAVLEERVEAAVSRGVRDGVTSLASREVLEGTTRTLARSSAEMMEERLGKIFNRRR